MLPRSGPDATPVRNGPDGLAGRGAPEGLAGRDAPGGSVPRSGPDATPARNGSCGSEPRNGPEGGTVHCGPDGGAWCSGRDTTGGRIGFDGGAAGGTVIWRAVAGLDGGAPVGGGWVAIGTVGAAPSTSLSISEAAEMDCGTALHAVLTTCVSAVDHSASG